MLSSCYVSTKQVLYLYTHETKEIRADKRKGKEKFLLHVTYLYQLACHVGFYRSHGLLSVLKKTADWEYSYKDGLIAQPQAQVELLSFVSNA